MESLLSIALQIIIFAPLAVDIAPNIILLARTSYNGIEHESWMQSKIYNSEAMMCSVFFLAICTVSFLIKYTCYVF